MRMTHMNMCVAPVFCCAFIKVIPISSQTEAVNTDANRQTQVFFMFLNC